MDYFDQLHLQRMEAYQHLDAAQAVTWAAAQWYDLADRLRAKGWRVMTPPLIADLLPDLPPRAPGAADQGAP